MPGIITEYSRFYYDVVSYMKECIVAWRKKNNIRRARKMAEMRSLQHNGRKYYIVFDTNKSMRVLSRKEIIVLSKRGLFTGNTDHVNLDRECVAWVMCDPKTQNVTNHFN